MTTNEIEQLIRQAKAIGIKTVAHLQITFLINGAESNIDKINLINELYVRRV